MSQVTVTEVIGRNPINLFCGPDCSHAWRRVSQGSRAAETVTSAQGMIVSTTDPHILAARDMTLFLATLFIWGPYANIQAFGQALATCI